MSDKSLARVKFHGLQDFIQMQGKLLQFCVIFIESAAIAQSICWENFRDSLKIGENCKAFLSRSFCCLRYIA